MLLCSHCKNPRTFPTTSSSYQHKVTKKATSYEYLNLFKPFEIRGSKSHLEPIPLNPPIPNSHYNTLEEFYIKNWSICVSIKYLKSFHLTPSISMCYPHPFCLRERKLKASDENICTERNTAAKVRVYFPRTL